MSKSDVCILIPTLNEAEGIASVISSFQQCGYENILVIDGGSTDGTQDRAASAGATVREQTRDGGKGAAVREGFECSTAAFVVLVDGDGTYEAADTERLVAPLRAGNADHVIANRFADMRQGAMSRVNKVGNKLMNVSFRLIHGTSVADVLTGFRAVRRDAYQELELVSQGFDIEVEMTAKSIDAGHQFEIVPTQYTRRHGDSKLRPLVDGGRIVYRTLKSRI